MHDSYIHAGCSLLSQKDIVALYFNINHSYRIGQNIRGPKLSQFDCLTSIHRKTSAAASKTSLSWQPCGLHQEHSYLRNIRKNHRCFCPLNIFYHIVNSYDIVVFENHIKVKLHS